MRRNKYRFLTVPVIVGALFLILALHTVAGSKHVIILLDTSGSMKQSDQGRDAIQWAKDVCALSGAMGVQVSLVTFQSERVDGDAIEVFLQRELPDENNMRKIKEMLDLVEYDGTLTDHRVAMERAAGILEQGKESDTAIVMLSDGDLDYVDSPVPDRERTEEEKDAIECFQKKCLQLAGDGCNIYLVGFGNDVSMFRELDGDNGIIYFSKDNSPLDIMKRLFADNGYMLEADRVEAEDGNICFQLDKNYYQSIINFGKSVETMAVEEEDVSIYCDGEKKDMDIGVTDLSGSAYLYLRNPGPGKYEIKTGNCLDGEYYVWNLEKYENLAFEVSLLDKDDNELASNEQNIYEVEADMMPIKLLIHTSGNIKDEEISDLYYKRKDENEKFNFIEKKQENWIKEMELPEQEGDYSYEIILKAGGSSESKEIKIACAYDAPSPCPDVEEENKLAFRWLKYDLKNDKISWESIRKEKVEVYIDQSIMLPGTSDETVELGEDLVIAFQETGEYHVTICQNGCTVRKVKFKVLNSKEVVLCVCAALLVLALLLAGILRKKRR